MHTVTDLALPGDEDAVSRLERAYERFMSSLAVPACVRPVVAGSWRRCAAAGTGHDGSHLPPIRMDTDELNDYRSRHPLAALLPMFDELLGESAGAGRHIFAITDAIGTLLWVGGHAGLLRKAERMNFVEGAAWSETQAGTSAPGTALAIGSPVQIFAAEHYNAVVHPWSCSAAPIRDPDSGQVTGAIDITGDEHIAGPHALALVRATVRAAEAELARRRLTRYAPARRQVTAVAYERPPLFAGRRLLAEPAGTARPVVVRLAGDARSGDDRDAVRLTALGRDSAVVDAGGRAVRLSPRHSEIVVLLTLADGGLPGARLAVELFEEETHSSTLRAEMTRLRAVLGTGLLGSRPYRLRRPVESDFLTVRDLLAEGRVHDALAAYAGPLLPSSDAPAVVEHRAALEQQVRGALLGLGDVALLRRWVNSEWGMDDLEVWRTLARRLPERSAQRAAALARARALDEELAAPPPRGPRCSVIAASPFLASPPSAPVRVRTGRF